MAYGHLLTTGAGSLPPRTFQGNPGSVTKKQKSQAFKFEPLVGIPPGIPNPVDHADPRAMNIAFPGLILDHFANPAVIGVTIAFNSCDHIPV